MAKCSGILLPPRGRLAQLGERQLDKLEVVGSIPTSPTTSPPPQEAAPREHHLAGATVLRGYLGYGAHSRIHSAKILRLSEDLPVVVEIVDEAHKIEAFLPVLDEMMAEGMVTVEPVRVITYRHGRE